jgi:pilus assembly protein CpaC
VNALFRFHDGSAEWTGLIDALREEGLVKVLAEPTLIALSGQTAKFLVGGEIPIPIPQGLGTVGIEYKPFGVELAFTPTVLSEKKISINVTPAVSEPDTSYAINVSGYVVPGFTTRRASTVVELADGQSFAIAGLLNDRVRDAVNKYPFLGDVPVLGNLFRSHEFKKNETELVIVVTPHLVKPLDARQQSLPTDYFVEPNDIDFYVWGAQVGHGRQAAAARPAPAARGEMEGDFGHEMPLTEE